MDYKLVSAVLTRDEGRSGEPYLDSNGIPTVGIGRNLKDVGIHTNELKIIVPKLVNADFHSVFKERAGCRYINGNYRGGSVRFDSIESYRGVVGRKPLSNTDMDMLLQGDIRIALAGCLDVFGEDWSQFPEHVRDVFVQVVFNLGEGTFGEFKKCIAAARDGDYGKAGDELVDSDAARETGERYARYKAVLATGDTAWYKL